MSDLQPEKGEGGVKVYDRPDSADKPKMTPIIIGVIVALIVAFLLAKYVFKLF